MKKRGKIVSLLVIVAMFFSYIVPIKAQGNWQQHLDQTILKVGYTEVYKDNKPVVPNANLTITITGTRLSGKEYNTVLIDEEAREVEATKQNGVINGDTTQLVLQVPGTLSGGQYQVRTTIDSESVTNGLILLNNVNLSSKISTNVTGYSGVTGDLIDGIQWAMYTPVTNKPTRENPGIFTFDYGEDLIDVYSLDLYSTYGNDQGPKVAEILYWDDSSQTWENILNNGSREFEFRWDKNIECEPFRIQFDQVYSTNKIMLKTLDSYTSWENTNDIVEVQVWGYKSGELPSIQISSSQGNYGVKNIVPMVIKNKNKSTTINLELVDFKSHQSLARPVKYQVEMKNGKLNYEFVIPKTVPVGTYSIHVTCEGLDLYSDEYRISLDQDINIENCSKYLDISLVNDQAYKITSITDGDIKSGWSNNGNTSLLFEVKPENNKFANIALKKMRIYTSNKNIETVTLKGIANTNYYRNVNVNENGMINDLAGDFKPDWKSDKNGDYFEVDPGYLSLGNIFILELQSNENIVINEIETEGVYLKDNLLSNARVYHNGENIDAAGMVDNNVSSYYKTTYSDSDEYILDFSPRTITTNELVYTAHFPNSQGIGNLTVEIWDGNGWKNVDTFDFKHKTDNQIRESQQLIFNELTTSKIRLIVNKANLVWDNSYLFTDLNAIGTINNNAQYYAESIDTNIVVNQGESKFPIPHLKGYEVSINSSDHEEIIDLNGNINAPLTDTKVKITLKVSSEDGQDVGITDEFEVVVPRRVLPGNKLISTIVDNETIYNNPSMGWVQYYEFQDTDVDKYWAEMDELYAQGLKTNILYIRNPWSWYEPSEGNYAWNDPDSRLSKLISGARARGIQLAFRVLVDSSDAFQQATPEYVFKAGASWYKTDRTDDTAPEIDAKDPYINDPVFLEKLDKFIKAFGAEFNNDLDIAFIDGMGFGNWGEAHHVKFSTEWDDNVYDAVEKVIKIYDKYFPDVLLGAQEGQPENYGTQENDEIINTDKPYTGAFDKEYDFVVRRDTFGWMTDAIRNQTLEWFNQGIPVFAENCYHSFKVREYWYNNADYPTLDGILRQVVADALTCRANTLDARVVMDCQKWLENDQQNGSGLLNKFGLNGGYRLALTSLEVPELFTTGEEITIKQAWRNLGLGMLPNKNKHWDNKYHVAFALLDPKTNQVIYQYNEDTDKVNPGDWLFEDGNNHYETTFKLPNSIKSGEYKLATAIVNDKNNNLPEIALALKDAEVTEQGWYVLDSINVKNINDSDTTFGIFIEDTVNGKVIADRSTVNAGESVTLKVVPDQGYELDQLLINEKAVEIKDNSYMIKNVTADIRVRASFKKAGEVTVKPDESKDSSVVATGDEVQLFGYIGMFIGALVLLAELKRKFKHQS